MYEPNTNKMIMQFKLDYEKQCDQAHCENSVENQNSENGKNSRPH